MKIISKILLSSRINFTILGQLAKLNVTLTPREYDSPGTVKIPNSSLFSKYAPVRVPRC